MIKKLMVTLLAAVTMAVAATAQPEIRIQATNLVGVNEQFNITFIISGDDIPSDFEWDPGDDFQLVWGPNRQVATSTTISYGKKTKTSQVSYTYILMPRKTGTFSLPVARATIKGEVYTSGVPKIEVVTDDRPSGQASEQDAVTGNVSSSDLFLRLTVSKSRVVVGEKLTATLKLYQRVNIAGFENAKFPDFHGFWSQEAKSPSNIEFTRESLDDKIYNSAVLASWTLIPQQEGTLVIDPAELVCLVNVRAPSVSTGSIFDNFFQDDYRTVRKRVTTEPVSIRVSALPQGAPVSFSGAVGNFRLSASLTRDSLATHEAASLKVTVTGSGNTALLEAPDISFPPDFEVYDIKATDLQSGKEFEYPFIPRSYGDFKIGPVLFSYYDIQSGKYVTLDGGTLDVKVGRGSETASSSSAPASGAPSVDRRGVRNLGNDIRYIAVGVPDLSARGVFFIGSVWFWIVIALVVLASAALYFVVSTVLARRADLVGTKTRKATKMARRRLSEAGTLLRKNLYTAFYEELHKALLGYVSDKLGMDAAELSRDNIASRLADAGVPEKTVSEYISLLDACEYARYSPDPGNEAMSSEYENAVNVISEIDGAIVRRHKSPSSAAKAAVLLLFMFPLASYGADVPAVDSLWNAGVGRYSDGDWSGAAADWESILDTGVESAELYYNLGNAYFKDGDISAAILNYERALRLDPSSKDAEFNLEFANSMVQDDIESIPEFFLSAWLDSAASSLSSNAWAVLGLIALALALGMVTVCLKGGSAGVRRTGFISAVVCLVLCIAFFSFAARQRSEYFRTDEAIVMSPVCTVKSAPASDSSKDLFVLHEGTKVKILDSVGEWRNIELSDGRQGWMLSSDIEVI